MCLFVFLFANQCLSLRVSVFVCARLCVCVHVCVCAPFVCLCVLLCFCVVLRIFVCAFVCLCVCIVCLQFFKAERSSAQSCWTRPPHPPRPTSWGCQSPTHSHHIAEEQFPSSATYGAELVYDTFIAKESNDNPRTQRAYLACAPQSSQKYCF